MGTIQSKKAVKKHQPKKGKRKPHFNYTRKVEIRELLEDSYVQRLEDAKQTLSKPTACKTFIQTRATIRQKEWSHSLDVPMWTEKRKVDQMREVCKRRRDRKTNVDKRREVDHNKVCEKVDRKRKIGRNREVDQRREADHKREVCNKRVDSKREVHRKREVDQKREADHKREVCKKRVRSKREVHRKREADRKTELNQKKKVHKKREVAMKKEVNIKRKVGEKKKGATKREVNETRLRRATRLMSIDDSSAGTGSTVQPATKIETRDESMGDMADLDSVALSTRNIEERDDALPQEQDLEDGHPHTSGLGDRNTCKDLANEFQIKLAKGLFRHVKPSWQETPEPPVAEDALDASGNFILSKPLNLSKDQHHCYASTAEIKGHSSSRINCTLRTSSGGVKKRQSSLCARSVVSPTRPVVNKVGEESRKDIRKAVEAACKVTPRWRRYPSENRAQIVHYIAKTLRLRKKEDTIQISTVTERPMKEAKQEVDLAIQRLSYWADNADNFGGDILETTMYGCTIRSHEPVGVIGIACPDDYPLLGFVSLFAPAVMKANTIVIVPSEKYPLIATNVYQVIKKSALPEGVVNVVTGSRDHMAKYLVEHQNVDAVWYFGSLEGSKLIEKLSTVNAKRKWVNHGRERDWKNEKEGQGEEFFLQATDPKNIWIPMTEIFAS